MRRTTKITVYFEKDRHRRRGDMLPDGSEFTMIDAGPDVAIYCGLPLGTLVLRGPNIDMTYDGVRCFTLSHEEVEVHD